MLVMSRNPEESIMIGDDIEVTLAAAGSGEARFAIRCPHGLAVGPEAACLPLPAEPPARADGPPGEPQDHWLLSRQEDEAFQIGSDIEIRVVDIHGHRVRLGTTAPAALPVHRREIWEAIKAKKP